MSALLHGCSKRDVERYPNVILVTIDTLRRDHVTCYGYDRKTTPNIADFARHAVIFDDAVAAQAITAPSHASILTGLYPPTHGVTRNARRLNEGTPTLGGVLKRLGYHTGAVVSGYTLKKKDTGLDAGFDHYDDDLGKKRFGKAQDTFDRSLGWLWKEASGDTPLFLLFHLFDPHFPYNAPPPFSGGFLPQGEEYSEKIREIIPRLRAGDGTPEEYAEVVARYDDEIAYADHYFGKLIGELKRLGLWENSIVVFAADHGETLDERFQSFDHGARAYEEQIRIPLIVRFPGDEYGGRRIAAPVHQVDLLPTILDALSTPVPQGVQGRSLLPLIRGDESWGAERHLVSLAYPLGTRVPEVSAPVIRNGFVIALRALPYKLISYPTKKGPYYQLFNLGDDPLEKRNIAAGNGEIVERLAAELAAWVEETGASKRAKPVDLPPETKRALEALGYVQ